MAKTQTQKNAQDQELSQKVFRLTMNSLKKRGIVLTDMELALCILYGRFRSAAYGLLQGSLTPEQATEAANEALKQFKERNNSEADESF